ncbi:sulfite exporter TauE/SafE family protein [Halorientalis halophila]|uniref:sulfite exporter TauE/SafE family protein n=1 Tax=Halorientalis halophila TaxID=3108499 RepID=UPI003007F966
MSNGSLSDIDVDYEEPAYEQPEIDAVARELDERPLAVRAAIGARTRRRLLWLGLGFLGSLLAGLLALGVRPSDPAAIGRVLVPTVILAAAVFETFDSASGMGFGTALSPLLFSLGYSPLEVVPALFIAESTTGLLAGAMHHEFRNVEFSVRPPLTEATRAVVVLTAGGVVGVVLSVALGYLAFSLPAALVEAYVAVLVISMGVIGLLRESLPRSDVYRPRRLAGFALLAGVNKGISGGGFGPVVTLGQIFAGVYEKTATAITSLAEGLVSLVGMAVYLALFAAGFPISYQLLPSLLVGSVIAAVLAPYIVRVLPGRILGPLIPAYAFAIGLVMLLQYL